MDIRRVAVVAVVAVFAVGVFPGGASSETLPRQKVAVLSLYATTRTETRRKFETLDHVYLLYLTNTVRMVVGRSLPTTEFIVLTSETMEELLPTTVELEDCWGECAVDVGRMLEVDYVVTGEVLYVENEHRLQLMVYECGSGSLIDGRTTGAGSPEGVNTVEREIEYAVGALCESLISDSWRRQGGRNESTPDRARFELTMLIGASWARPYLTNRGFAGETAAGEGSYGGEYVADHCSGLSYNLSAGMRLISDPVYVIPGVVFGSVQYWPSSELRDHLTSIDPEAELTVHYRTYGASIKLLATEAEVDPGGAYFEFLIGRYELVTKTVFLSDEQEAREHGIFYGAGLGGRFPMSDILAADLQIACHFARPDLFKFVLSLGMNVAVGGW
ncbi:MAG: hypothetical protein JSW58_04625 [Candidatus Latescibacterota bacterium]|nr:MAG: hypothetical protein JSW58_04625 [Candidatus Latescibacterota bacterium]